MNFSAENRYASVDGIDRLVDAVTAMRAPVARGDRHELEMALERARHARLNLPRRLEHPEELVEVQVPVLDRPGVIAEITTLLAELDVNVEGLDLTHSPEGPQGVLVLVLRAEADERVRRALSGRGYRPSSRPL